MSIGYGHLIQSHEAYLKTSTINVAKAVLLMQADIAPLESQLNAAKYPFTQNQFDSLISFGYNEGSGALSTILHTWNASHDPKQLTAEMAKYTKIHKDGVLVADSTLEKRRVAEILNFNKPVIASTLIAVIFFGVGLYFLT